jgi:four helix bundle protein
MNSKRSILKDQSFQFALEIIKLYKKLTYQDKEFVLSKQLFRAGTSVGANIREAQNAQSSADFIHKLYIAQKECDETLYWLELLHQSVYLNHNYLNKHIKVQTVFSRC